jgi:hypothetical protein
MKKLYTSLLLSASLLLITTTTLLSQVPELIWDDHYPPDYTEGNYTANDIKESPYLGSYVIVGSRNMTWEGNGYNAVLVMRVDDEGGSIEMNEIFLGHSNSIPWDQVANDMIFIQEENLRYLVTGYRDTTLTSAETPPGLFLMEIHGDGRVAFDSLYFNHTMHHMHGYSIAPAIGGGCIIAGLIRENGESPDKILVTHMAKDNEGRWESPIVPVFKAIAVGESGYARWVRQFAGGYLLGGTAYNGANKKFDMFLQKIDPGLGAEWLTFYGGIEMDEFSDALVTDEYIYLAGSSEALVPGTSFYYYHIYVAKLDAQGTVIWENTYGGTTQHFANKIMWGHDGNLIVAATVEDQSRLPDMVLMGIDEDTGESLWTQSYKTNFHDAGIRDAIPTSNFGYMVAGRASFTMMQDPRIHLMKLDNGSETVHMMIPREHLDLVITPYGTVTDQLDFSVDVENIYAINVMIDTLLHPAVGDLEISLSHAGVDVTLVDRPPNSGENFIHTGFVQTSHEDIEEADAPYTGWWPPVGSFLDFQFHSPKGVWDLTITDHGSGGTKAPNMLLGWTLNLLVESGGGGTGISPEEQLAGFGLEQVMPNPLNEEAMISFRLPKPGHVKLTVYNQLGQVVGKVADEEFTEGLHERIWSPTGLAPGTYVIQLESGGMISVRKALIAR